MKVLGIELKIVECVNSYGENCMYPCSENCINRICDRFNGSCMCNLQDGGKHHQGMLLNEIPYIQYSQND